MEGYGRSFSPAAFSVLTAAQTRCVILLFDLQCLAVYFLMFYIDPDPHIRIYFMFYICSLTIPTSYIVVFGTKKWIRWAILCQLIRMALIGFHNVLYPILTASLVAARYGGTDPTMRIETVVIHSTAIGLVMFIVSIAASFWEPAKLYQMQRLEHLFPQEAAEAEADEEARSLRALEQDLESRSGLDEEEENQEVEDVEDEAEEQEEQESSEVDSLMLEMSRSSRSSGDLKNKTRGGVVKPDNELFFRPGDDLL